MEKPLTVLTAAFLNKKACIVTFILCPITVTEILKKYSLKSQVASEETTYLFSLLTTDEKMTVRYTRIWQTSCIRVVLKCQATTTEVTDKLYHRANPRRMDGWGMALTQRNATEVFPATVQKDF